MELYLLYKIDVIINDANVIGKQFIFVMKYFIVSAAIAMLLQSIHHVLYIADKTRSWKEIQRNSHDYKMDRNILFFDENIMSKTVCIHYWKKYTILWGDITEVP